MTTPQKKAAVQSEEGGPAKQFKNPSTFRTLARHDESVIPSSRSAAYPRLQKISAPHIESFNSIFSYESPQKGLLDKAITSIGSKVVFDGKASRNKIERKFSQIAFSFMYVTR